MSDFQYDESYGPWDWTYDSPYVVDDLRREEEFPCPSYSQPDAPIVPVPTPDSFQVSPVGPKPPPVKKGFGREAKGQSPTRWDDYDYEHGPGWVRLKDMGKEGISMTNVLKVVARIDDMCRTQGLPAQRRPRMANRRKAVTFHFLDERWGDIGSGIFDRALGEVLGESSGVQKRGPKGKQ
jgi:hypothetical protein